MSTGVLRDTLPLVSDMRTLATDVISGLDTVMKKHKLSVMYNFIQQCSDRDFKYIYCNFFYFDLIVFRKTYPSTLN